MTCENQLLPLLTLIKAMHSAHRGALDNGELIVAFANDGEPQQLLSALASENIPVHCSLSNGYSVAAIVEHDDAELVTNALWKEWRTRQSALEGSAFEMRQRLEAAKAIESHIELLGSSEFISACAIITGSALLMDSIVKEAEQAQQFASEGAYGQMAELLESNPARRMIDDSV